MKKKKTVNPRFRTVENSRAYCSLSGRLPADPTVCSDWGLLHLNYLPTSGHDKYDDHHGHNDDHGGHNDHGGGVQNESYIGSGGNVSENFLHF